MEEGNLKTEKPYLRIEDRAFHFLSPVTPFVGPLPTGRQAVQTEGGAGGVGGSRSITLCFEDKNDFQPNPVFNNL